MKAMVLAAGLGTRLRPLTFEIPKPMVPVLDRPVMAHIVDLCRRQGFDELVANLHYFPDTIRDYFGDRLEDRYEEELLGTAGGVRNVRDFFGDEPVVGISGDALTDIDLNKLVERHRRAGGDGKPHVEVTGDEVAQGVRVGEGSSIPDDSDVQGPVWIGRDCQIGDGVRLMGPVVIGDRARVGAKAALRDSIVFPGTDVAPKEILI